jgi:hypothetical protein
MTYSEKKLLKPLYDAFKRIDKWEFDNLSLSSMFKQSVVAVTTGAKTNLTGSWIAKIDGILYSYDFEKIIDEPGLYYLKINPL